MKEFSLKEHFNVKTETAERAEVSKMFNHLGNTELKIVSNGWK